MYCCSVNQVLSTHFNIFMFYVRLQMKNELLNQASQQGSQEESVGVEEGSPMLVSTPDQPLRAPLVRQDSVGPSSNNQLMVPQASSTSSEPLSLPANGLAIPGSISLVDIRPHNPTHPVSKTKGKGMRKKAFTLDGTDGKQLEKVSKEEIYNMWKSAERELHIKLRESLREKEELAYKLIKIQKELNIRNAINNSHSQEEVLNKLAKNEQEQDRKSHKVLMQNACSQEDFSKSKETF